MDLKTKLIKWMLFELDTAPDFYRIHLYDFNATLLAENAALESGLIEDGEAALNDETHVVWEAAQDAVEIKQGRTQI